MNISTMSKRFLGKSNSSEFDFLRLTHSDSEVFLTVTLIPWHEEDKHGTTSFSGANRQKSTAEEACC